MNPEHRSPRAGDNFLRLAGYADGELDPHIHRQVEEWLNNHPDALEVLRGQQQFAAHNSEFLSAATPPEPSPETWDALLQRVEAELKLNKSAAVAGTARNPDQRFGVMRITLWTASAAACLGVAWLIGLTISTSQPIHQVATPTSDPLTTFGSLTLAAREDVLVEAIAGDPGLQLPGYELPIPDQLQFASNGEVAIERLTDSPAGVAVTLTSRQDGLPMIYASITPGGR